MTTQEAGWYWAEGDPEGTKRYWTGEAWAPGIVGLEPWRRAGAKIIDIAIMIVFALLLGLIFGGGVGSTYLLTLLTLIVAVCYEVGFVTTKGGTPGKLILGFRIVEVENGMTPPKGSVAALRWAPGLIGVIPFVGAIASIAIFVMCVYWLFSDPNRQTVYDRVAKTYVVLVPKNQTVL